MKSNEKYQHLFLRSVVRSFALNSPTAFCQTTTQLFAPGVVSTEFMETSAAFTPDGKTVYFTRSDVQFSDNTIMKSRFAGGQWQEPEVAAFSGEWRDSERHLTAYHILSSIRQKQTLKLNKKP